MVLAQDVHIVRCEEVTQEAAAAYGAALYEYLVARDARNAMLAMKPDISAPAHLFNTWLEKYSPIRQKFWEAVDQYDARREALLRWAESPGEGHAH